jgi:CHASE2 domain-containing sensor protein
MLMLALSVTAILATMTYRSFRKPWGLIAIIVTSANSCLSCIAVNGQGVCSPLSPPISIGLQLRLDSTDSWTRYKALGEDYYIYDRVS